jgi:hypothetical protein
MPTVPNIDSVAVQTGTPSTPAPPETVAKTSSCRPRRTPTTVARQQAGWLVSSGVANCLTAQEVQFVRFASLYNSFIGTDSWWKRPTDIAEAADIAGLVKVENGWALDEHQTAPYPCYNHPTVSDELERRAYLLTSAWAWNSDLGFPDAPAAPPAVDLTDPYDVVAAHMWRHCGPWAWAYWCCRIQEGDDAASVSVRSVTTWATVERLGRKTPMTPVELLERHSRWAWWERQPKLAPKYLAEAAKAAKIKLL